MSGNEVAVDEARMTMDNETMPAPNAVAVEKHEVIRQAVMSSPGDEMRIAVVAARIREAVFDLIVKGDRVTGQARVAARLSQFLDYGFGVLYALLAIRLVLAFIAASSTNGFVQIVTAVTNPFYAPFRGIVASPTMAGGRTLVVPLLIAIAVYALVHFGLNRLLRVVGRRKTTI